MIALLPDEDVTSVEHYITSSWAWTLRVSTKAADGSLPVYFVKVRKGGGVSGGGRSKKPLG